MLTIRFYDGGGWLAFSDARTVLRARSAHEVPAVLSQAETAQRQGAWIAGCVGYDGGAVLGLFDAPAQAAPPEAPFAFSPLLPLLERAAYDRALAEIARRIYNGDVYQVNYTMPFAISIEGSAEAAWASIARTTGARYQAYLRDGKRHVLSWSPELFLRFDEGRLSTKPMKGTAPLHAIDDLQSEKNRAEHVMIVDLLRNDLQQVCAEVAADELCSVERYATFATMTSTITGNLDANVPLDAIFRATFPCGSVTGAPKRAAMAAIETLEDRPRGAYCGALGFLSPQRRGWWNVAIRTAQIEGTSGTFHAGGGIVADSDSESEWREALLKAAFLQHGFELWETLRGDAAPDVVEAHLARMEASAKRMSIPFDAPELRAKVSRRAGAHLLRLRLRNDGAVTVIEEPVQRFDEVRIAVSDERVTSRDPWLAIKSSWRPHHKRAWEYAQSRGCFDALLSNEAGELTEGTRTNLFAEFDGELMTPPLHCGLLPGVLRASLIKSGRARERVIRVEDLERATALYVGNSARGLIRAHLL